MVAIVIAAAAIIICIDKEKKTDPGEVDYSKDDWSDDWASRSSMSTSNCCFLTSIQVSQEADQVVWYSHLFQNFPQDWKRSVFIPIPKKGHAKECLNYCTIELISHASKVMLKILQARLQ